MKKKRYIIPSIENFYFSIESLMITASPGITNDEFDPENDEVGAKEGPSVDTEYPNYSPWED